MRGKLVQGELLQELVEETECAAGSLEAHSQSLGEQSCGGTAGGKREQASSGEGMGSSLQGLADDSLVGSLDVYGSFPPIWAPKKWVLFSSDDVR